MLAATLLALATLGTGPLSEPPDDEMTSEPVTMSSAAASSTAPQPVEAPEVALARILADSRYAFCHDEKRPVKESPAYCEYAREHVAACPAYAAACAKATPRPGSPSGVPEDDHDGFRLTLAPAIAGVAQIAFWALLFVAVGYWLFMVARHLYEGRGAEEPEERPAAPLPVPMPDEAPRSGRVVDRDALLLLSRSRKALADGDLRGAARFAHAALVRALEAKGHLHVERSSTNGDYERALRHLPDLCGTFRKVALEVERSEFGEAPPAPERLQQILSWVEPVVRGVVAVALFVGALSLSACGGSSGWERPEDGPGGDSVLRALLESRGARVTRRSRPVAELSDEATDTVVVLPSAPLSPGDWKELSEWVLGGGFLVVVGRPLNLPDDLGVKKWASARCAEAASAAPLGDGFEASKVVFRDVPLAPEPEWRSLVTCGGGAVVATREHDDGNLLHVADARFLTNASLAARDHARVVLEFLGTPNSISLIDQRIEAGTDSPYRAMARSGLLPALIQGLVLMLLVALARGASFGMRRELVLPPRRAFAEHVQAVGRLYARAGASRHALGAYAAWALERLNARVGRAGANRVLDNAAIIAQTTGRAEHAVTRILADATDARERPGLENAPAEDHATFVALDELVRNTGGIK